MIATTNCFSNCFSNDMENVLKLNHMIGHLNNIFLPAPICLEPKKVVYNDPATIVIWTDGTKTVVKKQDTDPVYDPEKGLALCFMKKALGNTSRKLNDQLHKWGQKTEEASV